MADCGKSASILSVSTAAPSSVGTSAHTRGSRGGGGVAKMPRAEMPFSAIEKRKGAVHFGIHLSAQPGDAWRVWRRYEEFKELQTKIGNADWNDAAFPGRFQCFCAGQRQRIEDRRRSLEQWLARVLREAGTKEAWLPALREFLQVPEGKLQMERVSEGKLSASLATTQPELCSRDVSEAGALLGA